MNAIELIAAKAERNRAKGYTAAHDDTHRSSELLEAATCFLHCADIQIALGDTDLTDPIENLVAAGALIVAEIERLQREKDRVR